MTPEGKVKENVKKVLTVYPDLYRFMPVQAGFGKPSLDFVCCHRGRFFAVETKRAGKKPTDLQLRTIAEMERAGAKVFVVIGDDGLEELARWLKEIDDEHTRGNFPQT